MPRTFTPAARACRISASASSWWAPYLAPRSTTQLSFLIATRSSTLASGACRRSFGISSGLSKVNHCTPCRTQATMSVSFFTGCEWNRRSGVTPAAAANATSGYEATSIPSTSPLEQPQQLGVGVRLHRVIQLDARQTRSQGPDALLNARGSEDQKRRRHGSGENRCAIEGQVRLSVSWPVSARASASARRFHFSFHSHLVPTNGFTAVNATAGPGSDRSTAGTATLSAASA